MAELATLARPYANAAFSLALANGALPQWSRRLGVLAAVAEDERVRTLLEAPEIPAEQKARTLAETCDDEMDEQGRNFLLALAHNGRLALLAEIFDRFEALKAAAEKSLDVEVTSAFPLEETQAERLKAALQTRFGKEVRLEINVDSALLGGAVVRAGDTVIDGSVRGRLDKLADSLARI